MQLTFPGSERLNKTQMGTLESDTEAMLARRPEDGALCYLEVGRYLVGIRSQLQPLGLFARYLAAIAALPGGITLRTAYRYIKGYEAAEFAFPAAVLFEAAARNLSFSSNDPASPLGAYSAAIAKYPPPEKPTPAAARKYLDKIEAVAKEERKPWSPGAAGLREPEDLLAECVRFVANRMNRLPADKALRRKFMRHLERLVLAAKPADSRARNAAISAGQSKRWARIREAM